MNKDRVVRILLKVWAFMRRHAQSLYFLGIIVFGVTSVFALRNNNQQMIVLRQAVYDADEKGGDVEGTLRQLREYVYTHMNTGLSSGTNPVKPPIQLKFTYERLQAQQQQQISSTNGALYNDAMRSCAGQDAVGADLVNCVNDYAAAQGVQLVQVPDALYKFDFTAAKWSPDLAGLSLVATGASIVGFFVSGIWQRIKRRREDRANY